MGLLYMDNQEHDLWENYIAESARLLGQHCLLYEIDEEVKDLNHDPKTQYKEPVPINILFESQPKPILKKMGWFNEDDDMPYLAYLTNLSDRYTKVEIKERIKISIPNIQGVSEFLVTNVRGSKINPLFWIVKMVPYRYNFDNSQVDQYPEEYKKAGIDQSRDTDEVAAKGDPNYKYFRRGQ